MKPAKSWHKSGRKPPNTAHPGPKPPHSPTEIAAQYNANAKHKHIPCQRFSRPTPRASASIKQDKTLSSQVDDMNVIDSMYPRQTPLPTQLMAASTLDASDGKDDAEFASSKTPRRRNTA